MQFTGDMLSADVLAYVERKVRSRVGDPSKCSGVQRWRAFVKANPNATLADAVAEFERAMRAGEDSYWAKSLSVLCKSNFAPDLMARIERAGGVSDG
jgi:hypothetical protein